jgi:hypothetical protein
LAQANDGIERVAALYAEKQYESKLLDQELQNLAISLKEAIGEKASTAKAGRPLGSRTSQPSRRIGRRWQRSQRRSRRTPTSWRSRRTP